MVGDHFAERRDFELPFIDTDMIPVAAPGLKNLKCFGGF